MSGKDFNNERQLVTFNEVKLFKNLRYLELRNILISNYMVDILSEVPLLENIVFRNCTFYKKVTTGDIDKIYNCKIYKTGKSNCEDYFQAYNTDIFIENNKQVEYNKCVRILINEDEISNGCDKYFVNDKWYKDFMKQMFDEYNKIK